MRTTNTREDCLTAGENRTSGFPRRVEIPGIPARFPHSGCAAFSGRKVGQIKGKEEEREIPSHIHTSSAHTRPDARACTCVRVDGFVRESPEAACPPVHARPERNVMDARFECRTCCFFRDHAQRDPWEVRRYHEITGLPTDGHCVVDEPDEEDHYPPILSNYWCSEYQPNESEVKP